MKKLANMTKDELRKLDVKRTKLEEKLKHDEPIMKEIWELDKQMFYYLIAGFLFQVLMIYSLATDKNTVFILSTIGTIIALFFSGRLKADIDRLKKQLKFPLK